MTAKGSDVRATQPLPARWLRPATDDVIPIYRAAWTLTPQGLNLKHHLQIDGKRCAIFAEIRQSTPGIIAWSLSLPDRRGVKHFAGLTVSVVDALRTIEAKIQSLA